jgi:hypothetical protein
VRCPPLLRTSSTDVLPGKPATRRATFHYLMPDPAGPAPPGAAPGEDAPPDDAAAPAGSSRSSSRNLRPAGQPPLLAAVLPPSPHAAGGTGSPLHAPQRGGSQQTLRLSMGESALLARLRDAQLGTATSAPSPQLAPASSSGPPALVNAFSQPRSPAQYYTSASATLAAAVTATATAGPSGGAGAPSGDGVSLPDVNAPRARTPRQLQALAEAGASPRVSMPAHVSLRSNVRKGCVLRSCCLL